MSQNHARKHPDFIVRQEDPYNAGPPLDLLRRSHTTPIDLFYVRSHGNVPSVDPLAYRLKIGGSGVEPMELRLEEIRDGFRQFTLPATLQCAGNRRQELIRYQPIPGEIAWGEEAIGHATWIGTRLCDVLAAAGIRGTDDHLRHVEFTGLDDVERENKQFNYGTSIPVGKALSPEVLLAYAMNGKPLEPLHGYPLRVVVPGYIGARSVKWLSQISVLKEPSLNYFQRKSYRLYPPDASEETVEWETGLMLGEMNLTSVICSPGEGEALSAGSLLVQGYTIASGDLRVARVDLSTNGGQHWTQADLVEEAGPWGWQFWELQVSLEPGAYQLVVRAVDEAANLQPAAVEDVWNFKGYMNNAWNRVNITVR